MKVADARNGVLTNVEVALLLRQQAQARSDAESALPLPGARRGASSSSVWQAQQNVANISEGVLTYIDPLTNGISRAAIAEFMEAVRPFKLMRVEVMLQMPQNA